MLTQPQHRHQHRAQQRTDQGGGSRAWLLAKTDRVWGRAGARAAPALDEAISASDRVSFDTPPGEATLIVMVDPTVAQELRSSQPAAGRGDRLREIVADAGLRIAPLHPDITTHTGPPDEDLMSYFVISVRPGTDVDQLVQNVRSLPEVQAAYLKPHDEAP